MQLQVKAWGNSQGIRISKDILQEANISIDDVLDVKVANGMICLLYTSSGDFGLAKAVNPQFFDINILIHTIYTPFSIHQITCYCIGEHRSVCTYIDLINPAVPAFSDGT